MKKFIALLFCILLFISQIAAFAAEGPKRIISLGPFITESLYLLGAEERIVGVTTYCIRPPEVQDKEKIGTVIGANTEKIISLKPDIVLATSLSDRRAAEKLKRLGIRVISFPLAKNFSELSEHFIKLGKITGRQKQAAKILKKAQERIDEVQLRTSGLPKPKVFIQVGARPLFTITEDSFVNDFIKLAGGINIAADANIGIYSREKVIEQNPDVIIIAEMGIVGKDEKRMWQKYRTINAVKNNRIHIMDSYKLGSPTPLAFAETLEEIAELLHPDYKK
jgi:iron complex transport system substrate-binding protein